MKPIVKIVSRRESGAAAVAVANLKWAVRRVAGQFSIDFIECQFIDGVYQDRWAKRKYINKLHATTKCGISFD